MYHKVFANCIYKKMLPTQKVLINLLLNSKQRRVKGHKMELQLKERKF